jgi:large conductance mechanosensitive channel
MDLSQIKPAKRAMSLFDEFKAFAFKGNVIDLAIGVIIGAAFGAVIKSLVDNILMPLVGVILPGKGGYEGWVATVRGTPIPYGKFLGDVVNFLIVALALFFFIVKFMGWIMKFKKEEAATVPAVTKDQELLTEIRDLLKQQSRPSTDGTPAGAAASGLLGAAVDYTVWPLGSLDGDLMVLTPPLERHRGDHVVPGRADGGHDAGSATARCRSA